MNALTSSGTLETISGDVQLAREGFLACGVSAPIFEREAGFAVQALMAQKFTMETALMNRQSVVNAVTNVAAMGLTLNPAKKQAYLVPRDGKICLDISYIGLLDLAIASGSILWGQAEVVHAADKFTLNGFDKPPLHERDPFSTARGDPTGVYVVVKTPEADFLTSTMPIAEVWSIRNRSSAWTRGAVGKKGPWESDPGEMIKKTIIKRAYKLWPKTERLDNAIHHLNTEAGEGLEPIDNDDPLNQPKNFGLTPERAKVIRKVAGAALQKFNEDNEFGAFEECAGITDNDEMQALWGILKPHSALRSAIKRQAAEARSRAEFVTEMETVEKSAAPDSLAPLLQASIDAAKAARA